MSGRRRFKNIMTKLGFLRIFCFFVATSARISECSKPAREQEMDIRLTN